MSDEAFARRFYSDRTRARRHSASRSSPSGTSSPARSCTRSGPSSTSCRRSSSRTTSSRRCRRRSSFSRGSSPTRSRSGSRSRTSRSGVRAPAEAPTATAVRVEVLDRDYSPEILGPARKARGRDLEAADGEVRVLVDRPRRGVASGRSTRTRSSPTTASGTSSARISTGTTCARSASRGSAATSRFATRRERDFRFPPDFDPSEYRGRPPWQVGEPLGEARIEVARRHRLVGRARRSPAAASSRTACSSPSTRTLGLLASWVLRQDGRARAARARASSSRGRRRRSRRIAERTRAARPSRPQPPRPKRRRARRRAPGGPGRRPSGSPCSRRCSPTCSQRCGESKRAVIPARRARPTRFQHPYDAARRAPPAPQPRQLRRRLLRGLRRARRRPGPRREGALRRRVPTRRRA